MSTSKNRRAWSLVLGACLVAVTLSATAAPKGAKAIFDSGEGGTIGMSVNPVRQSPVAAANPVPVANKYVGISYQILAIDNDGQMRPVSKSRVFRSGERVKILASTNRPGYLTVANIGSSGRMHILFSEYVEAHKLTQIPPNTNLRFDDNPGTENVLIMLSNEPSQFGGPAAGGQMVSAPPPAPVYSPQPTAGYTSSLPPPPPMPMAAMDVPMPQPVAVPEYSPLPPDQASASMVASLEGAKSLKAKGAKDLMVEDSMQSSYAVVSPRQGYKTVSGGAKDLIMESSAEGTNYGLVPVAAMAGGGILTLEIKLKHR